MKIARLVLLLSSLQLTAEGKPLGCSQISQIEIYYPTNPGAENKCVPCPECPEGQGLTPQCGSKRPNDTRIECVQCQANVSYSNIHGIESCKACHDCGLKNIIQHCTPERNRKCGTKCPQRHFLDDNNICQECYFCCDSVSDTQRHQVCINIGMTRNWQCEKTEENQRCYEDWKKETTTPKKDKEQEYGAVSFRVVIGVVTTIFFISALALVGLMTSKRVKQFCQFSRPFNQRNLQEDDPESIPLNSICGHTDLGRASPQDVVTTEVPPLSWADNNLTTEGHVQCGEEVCKPNQADIPTESTGHDCIWDQQVQNIPNFQSLLKELKIDLDPRREDGGDYRSLAGEFGKDRRYILYLKDKPSPTEELLDGYRPTLRKLYQSLASNGVNRRDVAERIYIWVYSERPSKCDRGITDINLTTEDREECGKEVNKPNLAAIPADCRISDMEWLTDNEGSLMLFYVKKKLDVLENSNRKTWRSIGQVFQVSSDDLDNTETEYMARRSPTESLLELLKNREKEPTIKEFVEALIICGRHDVADVICNWPWTKHFVPVCNESLCDMVQ